MEITFLASSVFHLTLVKVGHAVRGTHRLKRVLFADIAFAGGRIGPVICLVVRGLQFVAKGLKFVANAIPDVT